MRMRMVRMLMLLVMLSMTMMMMLLLMMGGARSIFLNPHLWNFFSFQNRKTSETFPGLCLLS